VNNLWSRHASNPLVGKARFGVQVQQKRKKVNALFFFKRFIFNTDYYHLAWNVAVHRAELSSFHNGSFQLFLGHPRIGKFFPSCTSTSKLHRWVSELSSTSYRKLFQVFDCIPFWVLTSFSWVSPLCRFRSGVQASCIVQSSERRRSLNELAKLFEGDHPHCCMDDPYRSLLRLFAKTTRLLE
jgi:hypothetical protein